MSLSSSSILHDLEAMVFQPKTIIASAPVITHTPYSTIDCNPLLYKLVYTDSRVDSFLTLDSPTGDINIRANQLNLANKY